MKNHENIFNYDSFIIENRISNVAQRHDGILHIDIKPNELFEKDDYLDLMNSAEKIGKGLRFLNLITVGDYTVANEEARRMSTSIKGAKFKIADAFVINTWPQKLVANFYLKINNPIIPTRFFDNSLEAIFWLNSFK